MAIGPEPPLRITPEMLLSRRIDFERRMRRLPPVTAAILVLLVAIFALEVRFGALRSREAIIAAGALVRDRVSAGEHWRLLTAPWLHGGIDHLVGNGVEVQRSQSGRGEPAQDVRLPAGDSAGEADPQDARRPAAFTVFFMSIAIVSGPTPPGTGVSAPATSRTDGACTSPTRT